VYLIAYVVGGEQIRGARIFNNRVETSSFPGELVSFRDLIVFMSSVVETGLSPTTRMFGNL